MEKVQILLSIICLFVLAACEPTASYQQYREGKPVEIQTEDRIVVKRIAVVQNECGHDVMMVTDFGGVVIKIDDNQNVLSLAAGYEMTGNTVKDVAHALPVIQVMTSPYGRAKLGELAIGQDLLKALSEVLNAARQQGEATQDIIRDGYKYSITVENQNVAFVMRKAE
nr:MAG TPA: hypothetical protein [Caudoviricetes sp.]